MCFWFYTWKQKQILVFIFLTIICQDFLYIQLTYWVWHLCTVWFQSSQQSHGAPSYNQLWIWGTDTGYCSCLEEETNNSQLFLRRIKNMSVVHFGAQCVFSTCCGVCEGEAWFGVSQLMEVMETHDVGSLEVALGVLVALAAAAHFIVKLGGGQRSQEGGVGAGDADSVIWRWEDEKRKWWVMQRSIGSNEAFHIV